MNVKDAKYFFMLRNYDKASEILNDIKENKNLPTNSRIILKVNMNLIKVISGNQTDELLNKKELIDHSLILIEGLPISTKNKVKRIFLKNIIIYYASIKSFEVFNYLHLIEQICKSYELKGLKECLSLIFHEQNELQTNKRHNPWYNFLHDDFKSLETSLTMYQKEKYYNYLKGICLLDNHKFSDALECFLKSRDTNYRIAESLNYAGICSYHLGNIRNSMEYFEKVIRTSSKLSHFSLYNASEVANSLKRYDIQMILLEHYYKMNKSKNEGSVDTIYKLCQLSIKSKNYQDAFDKFRVILEQVIKYGTCFPSKSFISEYAYVLNLLNKPEDALKLYERGCLDDHFTKCVKAHTFFLLGRYEESEDLIHDFREPIDLANKAIFSYMKSDYKTALENLKLALKKKPNSKAITRIQVLIKLSDPKNIIEASKCWNSIYGISWLPTHTLINQVYQSLLENKDEDRLLLFTTKQIVNS